MNKAEIMAFAKRCRDYAGVDTMIDPMNTAQKMYVAQLADLSIGQRIRILEERVSMLENQKSVSVPEFCKVATEEVCSIALECLNLSDLIQKSNDEEIIQGVKANEIQSALNRAFYAGYRFATKG